MQDEPALGELASQDDWPRSESPTLGAPPSRESTSCEPSSDFTSEKPTSVERILRGTCVAATYIVKTHFRVALGPLKEALLKYAAPTVELGTKKDEPGRVLSL